MKKFILSTVLYSIPFLMHAQGAAVVSAPVLEGQGIENKVTLSKQLMEAGKQTAQLKESAEELKKSTDLYYKVSNTLRNAALVKNTLQKQISFITECGRIFSDMGKKKISSQQAYSDFKSNVNALIDANKQNVDLVKTILTDNGLRMNDAERIKILMEISESTEKLSDKANRYRSAFEHYNDMRNFMQNNFGPKG